MRKASIEASDTENVDIIKASLLRSLAALPPWSNNNLEELYGTLNTDALAEALLPDDTDNNLKHLRAIKSTGNGNCL